MTMTILEGKDKSISLKFFGDVTMIKENDYTVNLPTVSCTKKEDAEFMQEKINEFVNDLSRELVK